MKLESISQKKTTKNHGVYDSSDPNRILKAHQPPNHLPHLHGDGIQVMCGDVDARAHNRAGDILGRFSNRKSVSTGHWLPGYLVESLNLTNPSEEKMFIKLEIFPNRGDK